MNYQERIKHCIELTKRLDPATVDLRTWAHPCGTVRCVIGHLCATPEAQHNGLELVVDENDSVYPVFNGYAARPKGWRAIGTYFGINSYEAMYIFSPIEGNRTADSVRARLEEFVK